MQMTLILKSIQLLMYYIKLKKVGFGREPPRSPKSFHFRPKLFYLLNFFTIYFRKDPFIHIYQLVYNKQNPNKMCYVFITSPNHGQLKDGLIKILLTVKAGKKSAEPLSKSCFIFFGQN